MLGSYPYLDYRVYKVYHKKQDRYYAILWSKNNRTSVSWAKYVFTTHIGRLLNQGEEVDHINNIRTDDRIENLQILLSRDNKIKAATGRNMVTLICRGCGCEFTRERRHTHLIKGGSYSSCSRSCSAKINNRLSR